MQLKRQLKLQVLDFEIMSTTEFDLYGLRIDDIDNAKKLLEGMLSIEFEKRYSDYKCGDYYCFISGEKQESFTLQKNYDDFEDEWIEDKHREYSLLLYLDNTQRSKSIAALFESKSEFSLLKHE